MGFLSLFVFRVERQSRAASYTASRYSVHFRAIGWSRPLDSNKAVCGCENSGFVRGRHQPAMRPSSALRPSSQVHSRESHLVSGDDHPRASSRTAGSWCVNQRHTESGVDPFFRHPIRIPRDRCGGGARAPTPSGIVNGSIPRIEILRLAPVPACRRPKSAASQSYPTQMAVSYVH
jgi:hypothetical protein